ncbi:MAG: EthD domain-containing protein [Caulobacterales bacterium]
MFKIIACICRKPGMSPAAFRDHYENRHVPLAMRLFPQIKEHRRNYINDGGVMLPPVVAIPAFDVFSELWFDDRAAFEAMIAIAMDPERGAEIRADEDRFLDRERSGILIVDEALALGKRTG